MGIVIAHREASGTPALIAAREGTTLKLNASTILRISQGSQPRVGALLAFGSGMVTTSV